MAYSWTTPITEVKGVGPPSAKKFRKLKIHTVGDLLEHQPKSYYLPEITPMVDVREGQHVIIRGTVTATGRHYGRGGWTATISSGYSSIKAVWFGYNFAPVRRHEMITAWGKYRHGHLQQPEHGCANVEEIAGGRYGVHTAMMRSALREVFKRYDIDWGWYYNMHNPGSREKYKAAVARLKHNELLLLHLAMETRRRAAGSVSVEAIGI